MDDNEIHESSGDDSLWYYERDGRRVGPFSRQELDQLRAAGMIDADTPLTEANVTPGPTSNDLVVAQEDQDKSKAEPPDDDPEALTSAASESAKPTKSEDVPLPPPPPDAPRVGETTEEVMEAEIVETEDPRVADWNRLREIAKWHRVLNLAALAGIVVGGASIRHFPMLVGVPILVLSALLMVMLARPLRLAIWAYAVLALLFVGVVGTQVSFVPSMLELSILAVVGFFIYLNSQAIKVLRSAGVQVGFLGASLPKEPPAPFRAQGDSPFAPVGDGREA